MGALEALKSDETRNLTPENLPRNVTVIGHIFKKIIILKCASNKSVTVIGPLLYRDWARTLNPEGKACQADDKPRL